jgi:FMN-dependent oxidoreductase (nitrilotriacetate monooxygenase family)
MATTPRQIHLALLLGGGGSHVGSWRLPEAEYHPNSFPFQLKLTQMAEKAKFDMVFLADGLSGSHKAAAHNLSRLEPLALLSAIATGTSHIGLGCTASTTYTEPYNIARIFGTLDHISNGRAGWNIVTGSDPAAAQNFGLPEHPPKELRYEIAGEFVEVCKGLWDSWEDGAFIKDKERGIPADLAKFHALNHKGKHFQVRGPLNLARMPQGYPVLIQAGSSASGLAFAAKYAEVVFTVQEDLEETKAFGKKLRALVEKEGRDPASVKLVTGLCTFIAGSREEAQANLTKMASYANPVAAMKILSERLEMPEIEHMPLDGPVPTIPPERMRGHAITLTAVAKKYGYNLGQLRDYASAANGHRLVFGSPEQVADDMAEWFESGATDGFVLHMSHFPGPLQDFTEKVVPLLQKRGIYRTEYSGRTMRDHLGLARPPHPLQMARIAAE